MLFGEKLKSLRKSHMLMQRQVASYIGIDVAVYCKFEKGERLPKKDHLFSLAEVFDEDVNGLKKLWLATKIYGMIKTDSDAEEILSIAGENILNHKNS